MIVVKITDIFQTRYLYLTYVKDMSHFLNSCKDIKKNKAATPNALSPTMQSVFEAIRNDDTIIIDIAGAIFTPDTNRYLTAFIREGIGVVDTIDAGRRAILQINKDRNAMPPVHTEPLPEYNPKLNFTEYVRQLNANTQYVCNAIGEAKKTQIELVILLQLCVPELKLNVDGIAKPLLKYVNSTLPTSVLQKYTEFYLLDDDSVYIVDFTKGSAYIQELGYLTLQDAVEQCILVPTVFGTKRLVTDPVFAELRNTAQSYLKMLQHDVPDSLDSYLKKEGYYADEY